jgi:large subunit ribosomal protein L35
MKAKKQTKNKIKTHKGAASRFWVTGTGKLMRLHVGRSHFRRRKSDAVKRSFGQKEHVAAGDSRRIAALIPYVK